VPCATADILTDGSSCPGTSSRTQQVHAILICSLPNSMRQTEAGPRFPISSETKPLNQLKPEWRKGIRDGFMRFRSFQSGSTHSIVFGRAGSSPAFGIFFHYRFIECLFILHLGPPPFDLLSLVPPLTHRRWLLTPPHVRREIEAEHFPAAATASRPEAAMRILQFAGIGATGDNSSSCRKRGWMSLKG
jgi:hypothetical protein